MFCKNCGKELSDNQNFCDNCGESQVDTFVNNDVKNKLTTNRERVLGFLCYGGIFCLIPYLSNDVPDIIKYHSHQGLLLFLATVAWAVIRKIIIAVIMSVSFFASVRLASILSIADTIIALAIIGLSALGIVNVFKGRVEPIPLIGNLKIFKRK